MRCRKHPKKQGAAVLVAIICGKNRGLIRVAFAASREPAPLIVAGSRVTRTYADRKKADSLRTQIKLNKPSIVLAQF